MRDHHPGSPHVAAPAQERQAAQVVTLAAPLAITAQGSFTGRVAGTGAAMAHLADVVRLRLERFPANCLVAGDYLARAGHGDK